MRPVWIILGLSVLASGCGPTDEEVGRAVMLASPVAFDTAPAGLLLILLSEVLISHARLAQSESA